MSRRATAKSLPLSFVEAPAPPPPASGQRAATLGPYRFLLRRPGCEPVPVDVPRRGQGGWTHEPRMVPHSDAATERAMAMRAEAVTAEMRGKRSGDVAERPKVDATKVRALLLDRGALDHHEVAAALGVAPDAANHVLTHLRNSGHVHKADTRKRPRSTPGDVGGPHNMGVWELTAQGRAATKREQKTGKKLTTYNDSGYRSGGRTT